MTNLAALLLFVPAAVLAPQRQSEAEREAMWPAPTAEDWARPVLITFQRTWEDALAVARETGRPILVCTNMDGEIASEHYAGIRYRQPEIAALYEPYVCVIASVYRHTPADHDEHGRRVPCPRFGSVTCSEHIAIEPFLYESFFDGVRVAPRHVMVEPDGTEVYDVYYAFDTQSVFDRIRRGIAERPAPSPRVRGDRSIVERVESRDIVDRIAVEDAYEGGDQALKRALLERARAMGPDAPLELLRRALFGFDPELAAIARETLASARSEAAVHLITEVLKTPLPAAEREPLVAALERMAADIPRARTVANVQRALARRGSAVDVTAWQDALARAETAPSGRAEYERRARTASAETSTPTARLVAAAAHLDLADEPGTRADFARLLVEDAANDVDEARRAGASGWALEALAARVAQARGDAAAAREHATRAIAMRPNDAADRTSMVVLALVADARASDLRAAAARGEPWPPEWLADAHGAYELLRAHPYGLPAHVTAHHDLLRRFGALGEADRVLSAGIERFPDDFGLHQRYVSRLLVERGPDALEPAYVRLRDRLPAAEGLVAYAARAARVAAESHRASGRAGEARAAYGRAFALLDEAAERAPLSPVNIDHEAALLHAGLARMALEARDVATAVTEIEKSFSRSPRSAVLPDGLNITPGDTARMLRARVRGEEHAALAARLTAAFERLAEIDPSLLALPDYERPAVPERGRSRPR